MGRQEGLAEGRQEGLAAGKRDALRQVVAARFGSVPPALEGRIAAIDEAVALDALLGQAAVARLLDDLVL